MAYVETWSANQIHIIKDSFRSTSWLLSAGASTTFIDAWTAAEVAPYIVKGVKMLIVHYLIRWVGNNTKDENQLFLRRNGETTDNGTANTRLEMYRVNLPAGISIGQGGQAWVPCDGNGKIEYKMGSTSGLIYMNIDGFIL